MVYHFELFLQLQYTFITQTNPIKFPFGDVGDVLGFGLGQNQFHAVALQGVICLTNENIATSWATISHVFFHDCIEIGFEKPI